MSLAQDTCDFKTIPRRVYAGMTVVRTRRKGLPEGWSQPRRSKRIKALLKEHESSGGTSKSN